MILVFIEFDVHLKYLGVSPSPRASGSGYQRYTVTASIPNAVTQSGRKYENDSVYGCTISMKYTIFVVLKFPFENGRIF